MIERTEGDIWHSIDEGWKQEKEHHPEKMRVDNDWIG